MSDNDLEYGFEPFAETEEYKAVNETIVRRWVTTMREAGSYPLGRILDIATGVGTMVQLLLSNLPGGSGPRNLVCVDMNGHALEEAGRNLAGCVDEITPVQTPVQELSLSPESVDMAMWGNGVHYLRPEEQQKAFAQIRNTLRKGGWFLFNSAFVEESRPVQTLSFYRAQVAIAVRNLRAKGIGRERGEKASESSMFLPVSHYRSLLEQTGFEVRELQEVVARLYQGAWEKISGFSQYAAGALHGYPLAESVEALQAAVRPALEQHGMRDEHNELYVPRNWYCAIARKA